MKKKEFDKEKSLISIGNESIERNFAGLEFIDDDEKLKTSVEIVKNIYKEFFPNCNDSKLYKIIERIKENRKDEESRYLLLISKSSESCYLLSSILENSNYIYFIGSQFKEDILSEEYQLKIINKIKIYMEEGGTIILKGLESVYPALYDLFNQNFTKMFNKNFG